MTDSYGKPANLTPALLWSSTAIRFQKKKRGEIEFQPHFLQSQHARFPLKEKKCLYLADVLLNPMSSQDTLVLRSVILSETVSQWTQTKLRLRLEAFREARYKDQMSSAFLGQEPFLSLASNPTQDYSQAPCLQQKYPEGIFQVKEGTWSRSSYCSSWA